MDVPWRLILASLQAKFSRSDPVASSDEGLGLAKEVSKTRLDSSAGEPALTTARRRHPAAAGYPLKPCHQRGRYRSQV
jgi:hypothetical protein